MARLADKLKTLPQKPGVYLFKDSRGEVLYVGKAKNLKKRVKSYFVKTREQEPRTHILISQIADIDYIIVSSELESLMLENNLIKQYRPRFNVRLRDDKNYQFIKIDYESEIPQVYPVRRITPTSSPPIRPPQADGTGGEREGVYFGPFTSGLAVKQTLKLLKRIFHLCANKKIGPRPCFYYHLGRCPGVCIGQLSLDEYRKSLKPVEQFLNHHQSEIVKSLKGQMQTAAAKREFEKAAGFRDKLLSLKRIWEKQKVVFPQNLDEDYFSLYSTDNRGIINLFMVREGKVIHQESFELSQTSGQLVAQVMSAFLKQYYAEASSRPKTIVVQTELAEKAVLEKWLKAKILIPRRGKKFQLLNLGLENARDYYEKTYVSPQAVLGSLRELLNLPNLPRRIEAYDISNIQGFLPVGSMVVFENGEPKKSDYRKFKINVKQTPDDVAMMREMLIRRFRHFPPGVVLIRRRRRRISRDSSAPIGPGPQNDRNKTWPLPDLIVIDGGKAQLNAATKVLTTYNLQLSVIGLAKKLEEIFVPGRKESIRLPEDSPVLHLLQRIRDEAHRFAITFYRKRHRKAMLE